MNLPQIFWRMQKGCKLCCKYSKCYLSEEVRKCYEKKKIKFGSLYISVLMQRCTWDFPISFYYALMFHLKHELTLKIDHDVSNRYIVKHLFHKLPLKYCFICHQSLYFKLNCSINYYYQIMVQKNREITLTTETVKLIYLIQFSRSFGHEL